MSIGAENDALAESAVVTRNRAGADETGRAHAGIVDPMRMDYARTMSSVQSRRHLPVQYPWPGRILQRRLCNP